LKYLHFIKGTGSKCKLNMMNKYIEISEVVNKYFLVKNESKPPSKPKESTQHWPHQIIALEFQEYFFLVKIPNTGIKVLRTWVWDNECNWVDSTG